MKMTSASRTTAPQTAETLPRLCDGDKMSQAEFHRRFEAHPDATKFELVGGTVYMASPVRRPHGIHHPIVSLALALYQAETPGVELSDNATHILGRRSEPQPDLALRIMTEYGGQSRVNEDEYYEGGPELLAEIAHSSREFDLTQKRQDYETAGVQEYLVLCVEERELHWFHFPSGASIKPNRQGVSRSRIFPGLWIHVAALRERDSQQLIATVQEGLASRAHAAFVKRLEKTRRKNA